MLLEYLKYRSKTIILIIMIIAVFASSYILFGMPAVTVLYPMLLCCALAVIAAGIDFYRFRQKHRLLAMEIIPDAKGLIETDYQAFIEKLKAEEKLIRRKAASDYNNMIEYYTVWAHQIKTPIASMKLRLQSEDSEEARSLMGDLGRIEAYVEMVLTFIRLDSDSTDYVIGEYELDEIIRSAIRKFSRDFISRKLSLDYRKTDLKVLTDKKWLTFIIEQIISNSVKYTYKGGVSIYMKEPGCLCIEDTGIGIAAEDLPRIFENGFTGFNGREDKAASGIGLYLCRRIAGNLGHRITVESVQGEGTKVILDLNTDKPGVE